MDSFKKQLFNWDLFIYRKFLYVQETDTNLHDPGKIPEIKHIMRLWRSGQEACYGLSVNLSDSTDYNLKK